MNKVALTVQTVRDVPDAANEARESKAFFKVTILLSGYQE